MSLYSSLLRSHFLVAAFGIVMLLVMLTGTLWLRRSVDKVTNVRNPTMQATGRVAGGVQRSLASLRGWVLLGAPRFKQERRLAWKEEILPSLLRLETLSAQWEDARDVERLKQVARRLRELRESQWWIEDVAHEPGNEPARLTFTADFTPRVDECLHVLEAMSAGRADATGDADRVHLYALCAELHGEFSAASGRLAAWVDRRDERDHRQYRESMTRAASLLRQIRARRPLLSDLETEHLDWLVAQFPLIRVQADRIIKLREGENWNLARHELAVRAAPIGAEATRLLDELSASQDQGLERDALAANRLTSAIVIVGMVVIGLMTLVSGVVSIRGASRVARPLAALSDAAQKLACGEWHEDLPIGSDDEVGRLTVSFNDMRARLAAADRTRAEHEQELAAYAEETAAMNESLTDALNRAEAATVAKDAFLASMSHELRTPLTAILGFSETLEADFSSQLPSEGIDAVQTIRRNGAHLLNLINDILDLSKIESGKLDLERIACSPVDLAREVIELIAPQAAARQLQLELEIPGNLPESISVDPTRVRQVLFNLLGNAIKFTERGAVRLKVTLEERTGAGFLRFDVVDTGIGIPPHQIDRLFKPFSQADASTTRKFGGTGLGLVISRRLARMHGGDITVVSEAGKGSTFTVTLYIGPVEELKLIDPARPESQGLVEANARAASERLDCRILLVEDGADNQRLIAHVLRKAGAVVEVADNGQIGLEMALAAQVTDEPFDLVLMDMQMPVVDGYEATRRLRQQGFPTPIVALTAHAMKGEKQKCLDAGCDGYAAKPIDRTRLLSTIRMFLDPAQRRSTSTAYTA